MPHDVVLHPPALSEELTAKGGAAFGRDGEPLDDPEDIGLTGGPKACGFPAGSTRPA